MLHEHADMGKRGPRPGTGGRPRALPHDITDKHDGSPRLGVRLPPEVYEWIMANGGSSVARDLIVQHYEKRTRPKK